MHPKRIEAHLRRCEESLRLAKLLGNKAQERVAQNALDEARAVLAMVEKELRNETESEGV